MDFSKIKLLSFDCYGTLIDWKKSVLDIIDPVFNEFQVYFSRLDLFNAFLKADRQMTGRDYMPYREMLSEIMQLISQEMRISIDPALYPVLSEKFSEWKPFPDTVQSLKALKQNYKLAIISNIDDDMFSVTNELLDIEFDYIITAQQLGSYKPSAKNFSFAREQFRLELPEILHVAQSIYHDIIPGNQLGWNNVWVNRYAEPERLDPSEFPNLEVPDLESLVKILAIERG